MDYVPYTHPADAKNTISIAGKMFHPGETRPIPRSLHPDPKVSRARKGAAPEAPPAEDDMESLRSDSVRVIEGKLPQLTDEKLAELYNLESQDDKPRKGVLQAVEEEQLRREADGEGQGEGEGAGDDDGKEQGSGGE